MVIHTTFLLWILRNCAIQSDSEYFKFYVEQAYFLIPFQFKNIF